MTGAHRTPRRRTLCHRRPGRATGRTSRRRIRGGAHFHGQRGAGPQHNWYRGARIPPAYRGGHYVVNDWRMHRLAPPPRGYHWVQYGPDYLLVAIATGVIAQIIFSN